MRVVLTRRPDRRAARDPVDLVGPPSYALTKVVVVASWPPASNTCPPIACDGRCSGPGGSCRCGRAASGRPNRSWSCGRRPLTRWTTRQARRVCSARREATYVAAPAPARQGRARWLTFCCISWSNRRVGPGVAALGESQGSLRDTAAPRPAACPGSAATRGPWHGSCPGSFRSVC